MKRVILGCLAVLLLVGPGFSGKKLKYDEKEKEFLHKVDLIMTLDERKEFRKMSTHHQRDKFVEVFWARRDPDLTDNVNPFRDDWLARYDYALAHFKDYEFSQTSLNQTELFLLLGPPTQKSYMVDISLLGAGYRNRYVRYPAELWTYEGVGFDYKRKQLKVQFIPTSAFGEYVAITDRLTDHFLRTLKFKFIVNPELDEAPLNPLSSADYQAGAGESGGEGEGPLISMGVDQEDEDEADDVPEKVTLAVPPKTDSKTTINVPVSVIDSNETPETGTQVEPVGSGHTEIAETKPVAPVSSAPPAATTALAVPTTLSRVNASALAFDPMAKNVVGLNARTGYFKSGVDKRLLLGRIGFPLNNVDFDIVKEQYMVPFQLDYRALANDGSVLHSDSFRTEVSLPSKRVLEKRTTWFSREFAVIAPSDRYNIEVQLTELNNGKVSYLTQQIEVPPLRDEPHATDLVFMDPNVNPEFAKFNISGKPYNLMLGSEVSQGDRLFPVTELVNVSDDRQIATIQVQALNAESGAMIQTWDLFSGELTRTNNGSFLLHPIINTRDLAKGSYILRLEVTLGSGDILLSEGLFSVL